VSNRFTVFS